MIPKSLILVAFFPPKYYMISSFAAPNTCDVHVVQTLTISLGHQQEQHARHHSMATVCRLSRSVLFPPQFKSLQEWFHYAFASSEIDGRYRVLTKIIASLSLHNYIIILCLCAILSNCFLSLCSGRQIPVCRERQSGKYS